MLATHLTSIRNFHDGHENSPNRNERDLNNFKRVEVHNQPVHHLLKLFREGLKEKQKMSIFDFEISFNS